MASSSDQAAGPSDTAPLFAFVLERDINLLLVEELSCSSAFRDFIAERCLPGLELGEASWLVRHSVARTGAVTGETDIELTLVGGALPGPVRLMIENKVDAGFQPGQPARYRDDAQRSLELGGCWKAVTCLVAPEAYLTSRSGAEGFDVQISYEDTVRLLNSRAADVGGEVGSRLKHRVLVLEQAISKARRGYVPVPHAGLTDFWARYWELAAAIAPSLRMERPSVRGGRSWWIRFSDALVVHPSLPRAFLIHKLERGRVQIEFPGWGERMDILEEAVRRTDASLEVWPAGKSAALALQIPIIDPTADFEDQQVEAVAGLAAAIRLQEWWRLHWKVLLELAAPDSFSSSSL